MSSSLNSHLASKLFGSLRNAPFKEFICDYGLPLPKKLSRGMTLTLSLLFSSFLKRRLGSEKRVGVVLPAGLGGILSNLALFLSDRIPVHLNFTLGNQINKEIIQRTSLKVVITATPIIQRFPEQDPQGFHQQKSLNFVHLHDGSYFTEMGPLQV